MWAYHRTEAFTRGQIVFYLPNCLLTPVSLFPCNQGLTVEDVCKQLRRLYVVKNFSLEHSVSITCDPSFSASNEIHVCIVSTSSHPPAPSLTFAFLPPLMHSYKKKTNKKILLLFIACSV